MHGCQRAVKSQAGSVPSPAPLCGKIRSDRTAIAWFADAGFLQRPGDEGIAVGSRPCAVAMTAGICSGTGLQNFGKASRHRLLIDGEDAAGTSTDIRTGRHQVAMEMSPRLATGVGVLPDLPAPPSRARRRIPGFEPAVHRAGAQDHPGQGGLAQAYPAIARAGVRRRGHARIMPARAARPCRADGRFTPGHSLACCAHA
jgi:hypothetical protein